MDTFPIKIEKGIPIPERGSLWSAISGLEIGDSFVLPKITNRDPVNLIHTIRAAARKYGFLLRHKKIKNTNEYRIWRVA